jgi:hypothetical protein
MKLRNKKTGEICDFKIIADYDDCTSGWRLEKQDGSVLFYDHIDEIKEEWEDYKPAEPLIKDEKIRKAVRAWAELHEVESVFYYVYTIHSELSYLKDRDTGVIIDIVALPELEDEESYTITELCGEEEE